MYQCAKTTSVNVKVEIRRLVMWLLVFSSDGSKKLENVDDLFCSVELTMNILLSSDQKVKRRAIKENFTLKRL